VRYGVLGPLQAIVDGREVDLGPPRRRALLALLLTEAGHTVPAERMVDLLWDGEAPEQALGTVHSYVSHLRRSLEPGRSPRTPPTTILTRPPGYAVAVPPGELDSQVFEALATEARAQRDVDPERASAGFERALSLWRGEAYEEFADEPFAFGEARRLHDLRLSCLEDGVEAQLRLGRHVALTASLESAVAANPLRERLRGQLMVALYRSGRQADALRAYEDGRRQLVEELGLEPGHELRRLEQAILDHDLSVLAGPTVAGPSTAPRAVAAPTRAAMPSSALPLWPGELVGRETELERLRGAWRAVRSGTARAVAVSGDAGIGKTRLANELAQHVHDAGGTVLWGRSTPEPLTSYQPFVEALSPLVSSVGLDQVHDLGGGRPALARLFPDADAGPAGTPNPGFDVDRYLLFDAVAGLVHAAMREGPALLVLDDLHWADSSTTALLVHLLRTMRQTPLLVVTTHRGPEVGPDHALSRALGDLRRDHLLTEVDLGGIDGRASRALIQLLAGPVEDDVVLAVHRRTEGNPFFIEEIVSHALDTGDWGLGEGRVPKGIRDLIERRLNLLPGDDRQVLAAAAVLGRDFDVELLAAMSGADEDRVLDAVERAARSNLLVEPKTSPGRLSFAHALVREVLLDGTMVVRRQRLHRAAANAIEAGAGDALDERAAEIAHHLVAAGPTVGPARTASFLALAATRSLQVSSYEEAIDLCLLALEVLGPSGAEGSRIDALLTLGAALMASGDVGEARHRYFQAAELAGRVGDGVRLAAAATGSGLGTGVGVTFEPGRVDRERVALLEDALRLLGGADPALEVWVLSYLVVALQDDPDPTRRSEASARAELLARELAAPRLVSAASIARRLVMADLDEPMEARLAVGRQAISEGDLAGEMPLRIVSRLGHLADLLEAGELADHDRVLAEVDDLVGSLRQRRWHWFVDVGRAGQALAAGRFDEAGQKIDRALARVGGAQGSAPEQTHALQRLVLERDLGRPEASVARLSGLPGRPLGGTLRAAAIGLALVSAGDHRGAAEIYAPVAAEGFTSIPRNQLWLVTVAWLAETAAALGDLEGCDEVDQLLQGRDDRLVALGGAGLAGSVAREQRWRCTPGRSPSTSGSGCSRGRPARPGSWPPPCVAAATTEARRRRPSAPSSSPQRSAWRSPPPDVPAFQRAAATGRRPAGGAPPAGPSGPRPGAAHGQLTRGFHVASWPAGLDSYSQTCRSKWTGPPGSWPGIGPSNGWPKRFGRSSSVRRSWSASALKYSTPTRRSLPRSSCS
jgi:DNA-binding SARP family transcriptional activator/tetratricopeptide (TPR) repeat protein